MGKLVGISNKSDYYMDCVSALNILTCCNCGEVFSDAGKVHEDSFLIEKEVCEIGGVVCPKCRENLFDIKAYCDIIFRVSDSEKTGENNG